MGPRSDRIQPQTTPGFEIASALDDLDSAHVLTEYAAADTRGIVLVGPQRRVLAINRAARDLLEYAGPLQGPITDAVRDVHFGFAVGQALHDRVPVWHESVAPDPDRLLRFHVIPINSPTGEPLLAVATIEDVTRVRYLETVRRDFVANVSHELRTPLASINLLVETLQRGAMDDRAAAEHFLHRIEVETQAMARLVEELLELSRLETGVLRLELDIVDLRRLVDDVASRLTPAAEEKGVSMLFDIQDPLPPVRVDGKRIEQVLMNLVHNAIKFTPAEGSVAVRAVRQGRGVQIEVSDTGVGMDPAEAARVFERFYKVDKGRNRLEGSGLGLAIARHLLALHGTQLQVVSEIGRGSRFYFALEVAD